jgi:hypothetical protein
MPSPDEIPRISPAPEGAPGGPGLRLRWTRPLALALAGLLVWGGVKVHWEEHIAQEQGTYRYHGFTALPRGTSDQLTQGTFLALLGGLRAVVANYFWIEMTDAWQEREWFRVRSLINLSTTLQPRSTLFWNIGAWQLAWNASVDKLNNLAEASAARRALDARFWINQGKELLERGVENNPDKYDLWHALGFLEEQKLHDYLAAARNYQEALRRPHAPRYLERFIGYDLERGGDLQGAYDYWKKLWASTTDRSDRTRAWDKVETKIRELEDQLHVPAGQRVFAPGSPRQTFPPGQGPQATVPAPAAPTPAAHPVSAR